MGISMHTPLFLMFCTKIYPHPNKQALRIVLINMNYTDVKNYSAGYIGWKKAGLPTAR